MNVVLDTNVLVSALLSPGRKAYDIVQASILGNFQIVFDSEILEEYERVLRYRKFGFSENDISDFLTPIKEYGIAVIPCHVKGIVFPDESDRKFYEVAKASGSVLVTGNIRHFPSDPSVMSTSDFHAEYI